MFLGVIVMGLSGLLGLGTAAKSSHDRHKDKWDRRK